MKRNILLIPLLILGVTSCSSMPSISGSEGESKNIGDSLLDSNNNTTSSIEIPNSDSTTALEDFTSEEKELMKQHLNGEVLPFNTQMAGLYDLYYDSTYECITIEFDDSLVTSEFITSYETIFSNLNDYSQSDTSLYEDYVQFIKYYDDSYYIIQVDIYLTTDNKCYLDAYYYDPYEHSWPSDSISEFLSSLGVSATIPQYTSNVYEVLDYSEYGMMYIYCYLEGATSGDNAISTYKSALEAQSYTVTYNEDYEYYESLITSELELSFGYYEDEDALWILLFATTSE